MSILALINAALMLMNPPTPPAGPELFPRVEALSPLASQTVTTEGISPRIESKSETKNQLRPASTPIDGQQTLQRAGELNPLNVKPDNVTATSWMDRFYRTPLGPISVAGTPSGVITANSFFSSNTMDIYFHGLMSGSSHAYFYRSGGMSIDYDMWIGGEHVTGHNYISGR